MTEAKGKTAPAKLSNAEVMAVITGSTIRSLMTAETDAVGKIAVIAQLGDEARAAILDFRPPGSKRVSSNLLSGDHIPESIPDYLRRIASDQEYIGVVPFNYIATAAVKEMGLEVMVEGATVVEAGIGFQSTVYRIR